MLQVPDDIKIQLLKVRAAMVWRAAALEQYQTILEDAGVPQDVVQYALQAWIDISTEIELERERLDMQRVAQLQAVPAQPKRWWQR